MGEIELKREIADLRREIANIKSQIGKSPIRIPIGGQVLNKIRWAFTKETAHADDKIICDIYNSSGDAVEFENVYVYGLISSSGNVLNHAIPYISTDEWVIVIQSPNKNWYFIQRFQRMWICENS